MEQMITTLVLGAGVSERYGYPSGLKLVDQIQAKLSEESDQVSREILARLLGYRPESIDSFVGEFLDRPNYSEYLKSIIAEVLFECEEPDGLVPRDEDFYLYLCHNIPRDKYSQYKIITFNYDRRLEFTLMKYLRTFYNSDADAFNARKALEIVHIHGRLPELPEEDIEEYRLRREREKFPYGFGKGGYGGSSVERTIVDFEDSEDVEGHRNARNWEIESVINQRRTSINYHGRQNFKFVHEGTANVEARRILEESKRILFIGFGYHPQNMEILGLQWQEKRQKKIRGTAYKVPPVKLNELKLRYPAIDFRPMGAMQFFLDCCSLSNPNGDL